MRLKLTPGQSCFLHGWLTPKSTLSWQDVCASPAMTLAHLLSTGLDASELYQLQPSASAWVNARRVTLADCPLMAPQWSAHPVRDFGADLGDIAGQRWTSEVMNSVGLTYADLVELGLTPASMTLFTSLTLHGWSQIGMTRADAAAMSEVALVKLFRMPKQEVLRSLK